MKRVLFISDDVKARNGLRRYVKRTKNFILIATSSTHKAKKMLKQDFDLLVISFPNGRGVRFLKKEVRDKGNWTPACFFTDMSFDYINEILQGQNCVRLVQRTEGIQTLIKTIEEALYIVSDSVVSRLSEQGDQVHHIIKQFDRALLTI